MTTKLPMKKHSETFRSRVLFFRSGGTYIYCIAYWQAAQEPLSDFKYQSPEAVQYHFEIARCTPPALAKLVSHQFTNNPVL